jgi:hypothetical protein
MQVGSGNRAPFCGEMPVVTGRVNQAFNASLNVYCTDPDGDTLIYTVSGLAPNSGLKFDAYTAVLAGMRPSFCVKSATPHHTQAFLKPWTPWVCSLGV